MHVPLWAWFAVLALVVALRATDLLAHRQVPVVVVREAARARAGRAEATTPR